MNQFVAILRRVLVVAVAPLATVALLSGVTPSLSRAESDGIYTKGSNWLSLRFGYAKRTGQRDSARTSYRPTASSKARSPTANVNRRN